MLNCPNCTSDNFIKSGFMKGSQRYKCKNCGFHYTVSQKSDTSSNEHRRTALILYLEGLGFRSIGRVLGFSHVAVYNWIRDFGEKLEDLKKDETVKIVEMDEMHSYVGSKKNIVGSGLLLIDLENDFSIVSQGIEARKQESSFGRP